MKLQTPLAVSALALMCATTAAAESYRLGVGDQIIVDYNFLEQAKQTTVDLDGEIRLLGLGSMQVAGRTLDEIEEKISTEMLTEGFSGKALVSVEIAQYAPVVVAGDVGQVGQFAYFPGMTIAAAIAVAGGIGNDSSGPAAQPLAFAANRRAAEAIGNMIQQAALIARLEAAVAGPDVDMKPLAPVPGAPPELIGMVTQEAQALLALERRQTAELLASLDVEIADYAQQIDLLDQRIAVKTESIAILEVEFGDLEELRTQGLTTTARTSALQQRLSDDREELLALEIAKVTANRNSALAERRKSEVTANQMAERLIQLTTARTALAASERALELARQEIVETGNLAEAATAFAEAFVPTFKVEGMRAARFDGASLALETPLLPGDILTVTLESALD